MSDKKVDPIHFFEANGLPVGAFEQLLAEFQLLSLEHEKLKFKFHALSKKHKNNLAQQAEFEKPIIH